MTTAAPRYSEPVDETRLRCTLCPHRCILSAGATGRCGVRGHVDGQIVSLNAGRFCAIAVDPVEKKPLFHFHPGSTTYSVAGHGCNMTCPFCQNCSLSQKPENGPWRFSDAEITAPSDLVRQAIGVGCRSISFTYTEPVLALEYVREVDPFAKASGVSLIFVTNGQINPEPLEELGRIISAANVDLKCFSQKNYRSVLGGDRDATLHAIADLFRVGVWVEVTTLVIPGFNDSDQELAQIASFIAGINREIPWHVSAFRAAWKWGDRPSTKPQDLHRARQIGLAAGLFHVYTGNVPGDDGEKTICPGCANTLVDRIGYRIRSINIREGCCQNCGHRLAGAGFP